MNSFGKVALALLCATARVQAADETDFDRMPSDRFEQLLRDGAHAYNRKDFAQAFPLVKRAACAGDKTSQGMLGQMYILGQGVARDDLTGYAWIKTAAEIAFPDFTTLAHRLEQALADERRTQANARADEFRKSYGMIATHMSCRAESRHAAYILDTVICAPSMDGATARLHRCLDDTPK